ncbi:hypothetical protein YBT020_01870 [Bacillus thuringiensis serovar finitimus YBT-020]|nr:hypothetical protein YBT020_01870 [Bacillus thuringiensis serovar finitimus YBT-020]
MKGRKCKTCNGRGFIFEKIVDIKLKENGGYSLRETGLKMQCVKCFGKGMK